MFQVLVVEDDRELRDLFCTVLEENGYHAIAANDGLQAFDLLESHYIDLIISDDESVVFKFAVGIHNIVPFMLFD